MKMAHSNLFRLVAGFTLFLTIAAAQSQTPDISPTIGAQSQLDHSFGKLPVVFEQNQGQWNSSVRLAARGNNYGLALTDRGAMFVVGSMEKRAAFRMIVVGAGNVEPVGVGLLDSKSNYFRGQDRSRWIVGAANYDRAQYAHLLHGVDLVFHSSEGRIEYDLKLAPHTDANGIKLRFEGAQDVRLAKDGSALIRTSVGDVQQLPPLAYQFKNGKRINIQASYSLAASKDLGFRLGVYDRNLPLVIDPVLLYSTHLGGSAYSSGSTGAAIAVNKKGNAFITGFTDTSDFPTTPGSYDPSYSGNACGSGCHQASFVTELNTAGTGLVYSTFFEGSDLSASQPGHTVSSGIAVDANGNASIVGYTQGAIPIVGGFEPTCGNTDGTGPKCGFIAKFNYSGSSLLYSSYIGEPSSSNSALYTFANGVAVDPAGKVYVTGRTSSPNIPTSSNAYKKPGSCPPYPTCGDDVFVIKLDTSLAGLSSLVYSTYLGGSGGDTATAIAVDANGYAYVTGNTQSTDFPATNRYGNSQFGGFVTKLNQTASSLNYSTLVSGAGAVAIAVDSSGNAYVVGETAGFGFSATSSAFQKTLAGNTDASVLKLSSSGLLVYATYLGGSGSDGALGVAVDSSSQAHVTGYTQSSNFPMLNSLQQLKPGTCVRGSICPDVFVSVLNSAGSGFAYYSTLLGGTDFDRAYGIALDSSRNVYVTGATFSQDFPLTPGAFMTTRHGNADAFISKIIKAGDLSVTATGSPSSVPSGGTVTYTAMVKNNGPDKSYTLTVTDALPLGTSFVSVATTWGTCTAPTVGATTGTITCKASGLAKGGTITYTIKLKVTASRGSTISNTVRATAQTQDLKPANNVATVKTPVT